MGQERRFSIKGRMASLGFAIRGLITVFRTEHNMLLHLLATIVVGVLCFVFPVTAGEAAVLVAVTGFVWMAEIFNTAIEKIMDYVSQARDERIRKIKDM